MKKKNKLKQNAINHTKEIVSLFEVKKEDTSSECYRNKTKNHTKENISFCIKWMLTLAIVAFIYNLVSGLLHSNNIKLHYVSGIAFTVFIAIAITLSLIYLYLKKLKK